MTIEERMVRLETEHSTLLKNSEDLANRLRRMETWQAMALGALLVLNVLFRFLPHL
jgi:hypothetical protein